MILVKIRKWKVINDLEHTKTSWEVATDEEFQNIIEAYPESDMKELFFSTTEVPKDVTYYVRAKRHFNASGIDYYLNPVEVRNIEESYGNMLLQKDSIIQQPYVFVTKEQILANSDTIELRSSKFVSNVDQHEATHWLVYDGNNKLLYANLNNKTDKITHTMPNLTVFKTKTFLKFMCVHRGVTGVESKAGFKNITINSDVNFEIDTAITGVEPLTDLTIEFKPKVEGDAVQLLNVKLTEFSNTEDVVLELSLSNNTVKIPWYLLKEGAKYKLVMLAYSGNSNSQTTVVRTVSVADIKDFVIKDPDYVTQGNIIETEIASLKLPERVQIETMSNGVILVPNAETKKMIIHNFNSSDNTIVSTKMFADGITLISKYIDYMLVKPVSKTQVVIDMLDANNKPTFLIYNYDINNARFTLHKTIKRDSETTCLGKTGSIIQLDSESLIYIPVGTNELKKLNLDEGTVVDLPAIPLSNFTKGVLVRCKDNRSFVGNGQDYQALIYNTERLEYTPGYSFGPNTFVNKDVSCLPLANGNTLIFLNEVTTHEEGNISLFNYNKQMFQHHLKLNIGTRIPTTKILLNNGYCVFAMYTEDGATRKTTFKIFR